jgi:hypothetical protein
VLEHQAKGTIVGVWLNSGFGVRLFHNQTFRSPSAPSSA